MYVLGQLPEPGTPEFGQLAAYRRAILNGAIPSTESFEQYKAEHPITATQTYGPTSIQAVARRRRAAIAATPIPETYGPPESYYVSKAAGAAGEAALGGLKIGTAALVLGAALLVGFFLWRRA